MNDRNLEIEVARWEQERREMEDESPLGAWLVLALMCALAYTAVVIAVRW